MTIYLGSRDVRSVNDTNRVVLVSDKICTHPEHINGKLGKDIALIRLPTEIKFNGNFLNNNKNKPMNRNRQSSIA